MASLFQRQRVDLLLTDLSNKFPYKPHPQQQSNSQPTASNEANTKHGNLLIIPNCMAHKRKSAESKLFYCVTKYG